MARALVSSRGANGSGRLCQQVFVRSYDVGQPTAAMTSSDTSSPSSRASICNASFPQTSPAWMFPMRNATSLPDSRASCGVATGWGSWRAVEFATEPVLLDSFRSMLHARRFLTVADKDTPEALLTESAGTQAEVTDQLGSQVRKATELLVNAISRADSDRGGALLAGVAHPTARVIEAGMMTVGLAEGIHTPSSFFLMIVPNFLGQGPKAEHRPAGRGQPREVGPHGVVEDRRARPRVVVHEAEALGQFLVDAGQPQARQPPAAQQPAARRMN